MKRWLCLLAGVLMLLSPLAGCAEDEWSLVELFDEELPGEAASLEQTAPTTVEPSPARQDFIDRIISLGQQLYEQAGGKAQRAHYSGDIYVCKNFTVYLFRKNRDSFRIAEYPNTELVIPNNLPSAKCKPYHYGYCWESIPAAEGNPFYAAAQFVYDSSLSKAENEALAREFMRQVKRGDYFQMSANYEWGVGAHSAIMISDYDPATDTVHWMDSNMKGKKVNGIRYGYVQFDEEKAIDWWVSAFCQKKRGATLYRLRDDIIYAEGAEQ